MQVVHGDVEEALDLGRVQVERQRAIGPGRGYQIGNQLGGDRHPANVLAVLPRIAVIGEHGGDPRRTGALEAVEHDQQLHQVLVHGRAGRLHDKDVAAAHVFFNAHGDFAVGKIRQRRAPERVAEHGGDALRQTKVGPAAEDLEPVIVVHGLAGPNWCSVFILADHTISVRSFHQIIFLEAREAQGRDVKRAGLAIDDQLGQQLADDGR